MNLRIFTSEQREYLIKNVEEIDKIEALIKHVNSVRENSDRYVPVRRIKDYLHDNHQKAINNLQPFIKRDKIYQKRKEAIIKQHGFGLKDDYDESTKKDIIVLQQEMLEEVSDLSSDLRSKKMSDVERDSIFREKQDKPKVLVKDDDFSR